MMNKVKLTRAQVDEMNNALDYANGDVDALISAHRNLIREGLKWDAWPALNDVTPNQLHNALKYGYEVDEQSSSPAPYKIHPIIALVRKEKQQTMNKQALEAELDYELASLHDAIKKGDGAEIERCKQRLAELHAELGLAGESA